MFQFVSAEIWSKYYDMKNKNLFFTAIAIFGFATVTMAQHQLGWCTYYLANIKY